MIINTGQRTDIPAFYSDWFYRRIQEGFVYVRNPYYPSRITKYIFNPQVVDCICFCTKNPQPMLSRIDLLKEYRQFWYVTITPYDREIEPYVPLVKDVIQSFQELSLKVGKSKVGWRYDPIFINQKYTVEYHIKAFHYIAKHLSKFTNRCVISFIDLYQKTKKNFPHVQEVPMHIQHQIVREFAKIAQHYHIKLYACLESTEFEQYGVICTGCMSKEVIEEALDIELLLKPSSVRDGCQCLLGNDIGAYNTCLHGCLYCYANIDKKEVVKQSQLHNPYSPLLIGEVNENDEVYEAKQSSSINLQMSFHL